MSILSLLTSRFEKSLWCIERKKLKPLARIAVVVARVLHISTRFCHKHQIFLRASALTLFTLLAVVPVLATIFGIAKGFGLAELVETQIQEAFASQEQVMNMLVSFSKRSLNRASGGLIAGIGVFLLFWTVVRMIGNVEAAVNTIWDVRKKRSILRRFTDYLFLVILLPLLLIFSSSTAVALTHGIESVILSFGLSESLASYILVSARLFPLVFLSLGLAFLYAFLPNTKVKVSAALIGGLIAALLFLLVQWLYVRFQFAMGSYGAIYGSFAALPLFLIWLQAGWIVILYGAELTRAIELRDEFEFDPLNRELSIHAIFEGASRIARVLKNRIEQRKGGASCEQLSEILALPRGIILSCCSALQKADILTIDENAKYIPIVSPTLLEEETLKEHLAHAGSPLPDNLDKEKEC